MSENLSELNLVFSTPIWTSLVDDYQNINAKMLKYIQSMHEKNPMGTKHSNVFGWHSENFDLEDETVKFFISSIKPKIKKTIDDMCWDPEKSQTKITNMWAIINKKGASNTRHTHYNSYLSAAYYIKAPKHCGDILFYDPRSAKVTRKPPTTKSNALNAEEVNITPQDGMIVFFPSYLHHAVSENRSDEERIVISFNVDMR